MADSGYRTRYPLFAVDLGPLLDGSTAGALIPELATRGLLRRVKLELAAFLGLQRHERTEKRLGPLNGYQARTLTTRIVDGGHGGQHRLDLRPTHRLAPSPHQSEARLPADLLWVRSRR